MDKTNKTRIIELALLSIFIISLPSSEALKNISWFFYIAIWLINRFNNADWGGAWKIWDTLFALLLPSGIVVAAISNQGLNEWDGSTDLIRYCSIAWAVLRSNYSEKTIRFFLLLTISSTLIALAYGYWNLQTVSQNNSLSLHSVGHVNHSAIYLAISAGLAASLMIAFWKKSGSMSKGLYLIATAMLVWGTLVTSARGAVIPLVILFLLAGAMLWTYSRAILLYSIIILMATGFIAIEQKLPIVNKTISTFTHSNLGGRDKAANTGLLIWRAFPLAGVGIENYPFFGADPKKLAELSYMLGENHDPTKYLQRHGHAHNLYINTLSERGIVGFAPMFILLIYWGYFLVYHRPLSNTPSIELAAWGGSLSAWTITTVGGIFNTTFHHEHAIISTLLLAFWASIIIKKLKP